MSGSNSPEQNPVSTDPLGRPEPTNETGARIFTSNRLLLMSRTAARRGDQSTANDLTDQVEEMGLTMFQEGEEQVGYHVIEESLFYEELNDLTLKGEATPENIAALYRLYGKEPPQD